MLNYSIITEVRDYLTKIGMALEYGPTLEESRDLEFMDTLQNIRQHKEYLEEATELEETPFLIPNGK